LCKGDEKNMFFGWVSEKQGAFVAGILDIYYIPKKYVNLNVWRYDEK
jgi:hypothetical protein